MDDLIRRQDAVSRFSDLLMVELKGKRLPTWDEVYNAMQDVPSAEPERKTGRWIQDKHEIDGYGYFDCSECGADFYDVDGFKYCPNCGARMEVDK